MTEESEIIKQLSIARKLSAKSEIIKQLTMGDDEIIKPLTMSDEYDPCVICGKRFTGWDHIDLILHQECKEEYEN